MKRKAFPPPIPLCRLLPNESICTVSMQVDMFCDSFNCHGYVDTSTPFLVSCSRPGSSLCFKVTDMDMQEWGPNWVLQHEAFKNELACIEWEDLQGKIFLVWDVNHHVKAWMSRIREGNMDLQILFLFNLSMQVQGNF